MTQTEITVRSSTVPILSTVHEHWSKHFTHVTPASNTRASSLTSAEGRLLLSDWEAEMSILNSVSETPNFKIQLVTEAAH